MEESSEMARRIVEAIIKDIRDRRGLRQEWEAIDKDVQEEVRREWRSIVDDHIAGAFA